MRTLVCTACGRLTSRYCDRCPFCKQRNLVMLEGHNANALQAHKIIGQHNSSGSDPLSSLVLVAALAGGSAAFLFIWLHPGSPESKPPADAKLISSAAKPAPSANH